MVREAANGHTAVTSNDMPMVGFRRAGDQLPRMIHHVYMQAVDMASVASHPPHEHIGRAGPIAIATATSTSPEGRSPIMRSEGTVGLLAPADATHCSS